MVAAVTSITNLLDTFFNRDLASLDLAFHLQYPESLIIDTVWAHSPYTAMHKKDWFLDEKALWYKKQYVMSNVLPSAESVCLEGFG